MMRTSLLGDDKSGPFLIVLARNPSLFATRNLVNVELEGYIAQKKELTNISKLSCIRKTCPHLQITGIIFGNTCFIT